MFDIAVLVALVMAAIRRFQPERALTGADALELLALGWFGSYMFVSLVRDAAAAMDQRDAEWRARQFPALHPPE